MKRSVMITLFLMLFSAIRPVSAGIKDHALGRLLTNPIGDIQHVVYMTVTGVEAGADVVLAGVVGVHKIVDYAHTGIEKLETMVAPPPPPASAAKAKTSAKAKPAGHTHK